MLELELVSLSLLNLEIVAIKEEYQVHVSVEIRPFVFATKITCSCGYLQLGQNASK